MYCYVIYTKQTVQGNPIGLTDHHKEYALSCLYVLYFILYYIEIVLLEISCF